MTLKQADTVKQLKLELERLRKIEKRYLVLLLRNDVLMTENKKLRHSRFGGER